ncbi:MAG TPA: amidase family protein [bacterium]|nr:amidase family protein [bacterium]
MNALELCFMPATELAAAIGAKQVSPVEAVEAVLDRIAAINPSINAIVTVTEELARGAARDVEQRITRGEPVGPLAGVPVTIKDLIMVKGVRTTWGSRIFERFIAPEDGPAVERLRAAGAVIVGMTNSPEFGYRATTDNPVFGETRNPWSLEHTPGGSTGGGAAAVAAGMGPLTLGTDAGGSIRIPASCCGVFGFKPTLGRVPAAPVYGGLETLSHTGPLTRTVRDAALAMSVIAGPDPRDLSSLPNDGTDWIAAPEGGIADLRLAWTPDWGYAPVDPEVLTITEAAVRRLSGAGTPVDVAAPRFTDPSDAFNTLFPAFVAARLQGYLAEWRARMDPGLVKYIEMGQRPSAVDFVQAGNVRRTLNDAFRQLFQTYNLLLTPTLAAPPLPLGRPFYEEIAGKRVSPIGWLAFTFPINMLGYPAATVPAGWTAAGLPVGLQIIGPRFADALVLRAAAAFEAVQPWADRRPPLS